MIDKKRLIFYKKKTRYFLRYKTIINEKKMMISNLSLPNLFPIVANLVQEMLHFGKMQCDGSDIDCDDNCVI